MTYNEVLELIKAHKKGEFFTIKFSKELPLLKQYKEYYQATKVSQATVRIGVKYDNIRAVAEKRATGELPKENMGLPWGEWDIPGYTIKHKGNIYLRVSLVKGNPVRSRYYLSGKEVSTDTLRLMCQKSAFSSGGSPDVLTISIDNIEY